MRVAVFASGKGSDFLSLVEASEKQELGWRVGLLITNNPEAGAIAKAKAHNIPYKYIESKNFEKREDFVQALIETLEEYKIDFIALAGYLKKIPSEIIRKYPNRIVNIHPALLPLFGGKGMYGLRVHQAVLDAGCKVSGVTVHIVNEEYDEGLIVAQSAVEVLNDDEAETLAERVLEVEHKLYPEVITWFAQGKVQIEGKKVRVEL
jgi:phosphoribosylglycinamide formyltransferase-1